MAHPGARLAHLGARLAQDWRMLAPAVMRSCDLGKLWGAKMAQDGAKMAQDGAEVAQDSIVV